MNAHVSTSNTRIPANQRPGYAAKMLELFEKLDDLRRGYCPMEDDTMDAITAATYAVGKSIIAAPAIDEAAIAVKFRYAALMIEDPDGLMHDEALALQAAFSDLGALRHAEWQAEFGKPHPRYDEAAA